MLFHCNGRLAIVGAVRSSARLRVSVRVGEFAYMHVCGCVRVRVRSCARACMRLTARALTLDLPMSAYDSILIVLSRIAVSPLRSR
jgi:hypothetical protein